MPNLREVLVCASVRRMVSTRFWASAREIQPRSTAMGKAASWKPTPAMEMYGLESRSGTMPEVALAACIAQFQPPRWMSVRKASSSGEKVKGGRGVLGGEAMTTAAAGDPCLVVDA